VVLAESSICLDQKRNKKIFMGFFLVFMNLRFQVFTPSSVKLVFEYVKRKELAALKQLLFLRILQTFDARLRKLRTVEPRK
jgi:hypothetical protein